MSSRVGNLLLQAELISEDQLAKAQEHQHQNGGLLGSSIVNLGFIEEKKLVETLSEKYGLPLVKLEEFEIDSEVVHLVPFEVASKHHLVPVTLSGTTLTVAMADPSNILAVNDIKFITGYNVFL